jgi:hypothetical protein
MVGSLPDERRRQIIADSQDFNRRACADVFLRLAESGSDVVIQSAELSSSDCSHHDGDHPASGGRMTQSSLRMPISSWCICWPHSPSMSASRSVRGRRMLSRRQAAEVPSVNKQNDQHGSESAFAQERTADAALGALSGAVVLGPPLGAVAGAVVG